MKIFDASSISEILAKRHPAFPQSVVAGWLLPNGEPVAAAFVHADKVPTEGQLIVAHASCLAAILKRIDEVMLANPGMREQFMQLVLEMTGGLEVVARLKNDLFKERG